MGLLDQLLGGMLGGGAPGGEAPAGARSAPGGDSARIMMALLPVVLAMLSDRGRGPGAASSGFGPGPDGAGGLGDLLGGALGGAFGGRAGDSGGPAGPGGLGGLGGLGALLEQLGQRGYREQVDSWVGTGPNLPVPDDALVQVFGGQGLSRIASQAGLSEDQTREGLGRLLPEVVDTLTPAGQLPSQDDIQASLESFLQRMGR
jgi:uncharacterized protein YidB (DUF937 family)